MANPNFYKMDFEREIVVQGKSSTYLTINRNDTVMSSAEELVIVLYPQATTFEAHTVGLEVVANGTVDVTFDNIPASNFWLNNSNDPQFNKLSKNLWIKNYRELGFASSNQIVSVTWFSSTSGKIEFLNPVPAGTYVMSFGELAVEDGQTWNINTLISQDMVNYVSSGPISFPASTTVPNPFDGTLAPTGTGYVERQVASTWIRITSATTALRRNVETKGVTIRVDYDGSLDSHLKFNLLIAKIPPTVTPSDLRTFVANTSSAQYGIKSGLDLAIPDSVSVDYQEVHFFGYPESYVTPSRVTEPMIYPIEKPIYEDRSSFGVLKTNPKLSGNVKITTDSNGDIWLNSFNANEELSDSAYKKFSISSASTYQKDLWTFFKKGQTPIDIVFDVYQFDDQYVNNKTTYEQQFDNFYNYGVEQLRSKFYDEDYSFLAPLWLRKEVPEYFVIFRVNHPINENSYADALNSDNFKAYFENARIIKTFDLRDSSKLGSYIRKITTDPRFKERPLEVSWEADTATYWNGISYQNGTITGKGEFLYDYFTQDREIKEFEDFITTGFQRNGIISTNLLNLEFLFNDEEADLYSINRYFGMYVTENQLAEFEIEPNVLGKISNQSPLPKKDVDGEPYSTRAFIQTNPDGIELPAKYYHSDTFTNNNTNIPEYQGLVLGKFPLPSMVEDPLRIFYVKDRENVFKRVIGLTEVDYGYPGTDDYIRATQLKLFDTQEDISKYAGVNEIVSQFPADLLSSGNSQLRVHLFDQKGTGVLADDEEILLHVKKYNDPGRKHTYQVQLTDVQALSITMEYFMDQTVEVVFAGAVMPAIGTTVVLSTVSALLPDYSVGQVLYLPLVGYLEVTALSLGSITLRNNGGINNVPVASPIAAGTLIAESLTGEQTYNYTALNYETQIDNYLTVNLLAWSLYAVLDAWKIEVDYPDIQKYLVTGSNNIDAFYRPDYEQFTWRMIANGVGLQPGDAWDYPQYDPNGTDYLSQFSNEGSSETVAKALALCINTFDNCPVNAWAIGDQIYLKSRLLYEEGNSIVFERKIKGNSVYANLGFYERGNVDHKATASILDFSPLSLVDVDIQTTEVFDIPTTKSYYVKIIRGVTTTSIFVRADVNPSSYATITITGTPPFYSVSIPTTDTRYSDPRLPFSIDMAKIDKNVTFEQAYTISNTSLPIEQNFVGGVKRLRNRAQIDLSNGQKYYQDRRVTRVGTTTLGSDTITIDTSGLYIGASVTGTGIPAGSTIIDVNSTKITISNLATASGTNELKLGELSILNDSVIYQQWYQSLKGTYQRMKGWDIQGKLVYSLPYLDEPTYDKNEYLDGFNEYNTSSIIQLDEDTYEFYYSIDKRIVAYKVYRPIMGIFSLYPIKQFDFDFFLSDYSYTPTIEAFKYFFKEKVANGESIDLDLFQNYLFTQVAPVPPSLGNNYTLNVSVYDHNTSLWYEVETIDSYADPAGLQNKLIFNTFYPLYDYDSNSLPYLQDATQWDGPGKRNYDRRYLYINDADDNAIKIYPTKFRVKYTASPLSSTSYLEVTNYNYGQDRDLLTFNGFAGLQDITSIQDSDVIQSLKDEGKFIEAFTYQLLLSEYDRLRENYNKDWSVKSKVVPYINKWVQEGTDARDNYYRLNNSMAFGLSNLSPISNVDFTETAVLTHEFPYIDSVPQGYPEESLEGSRSYQFEKLSDIPAKGLSWYDLISTDNTNDWFTKYFSIGYPTEKNYEDVLIKRPREERFTFFNYINGISRSQSLFRGGKVQGIVYDTSDPLNIVEVSNSELFDGYKFSAITRFDSFDLYTKQKPVDIEVIRNEKYKWVVLLITIRTQDYRTQSGGGEYMFQYFMEDLIINSHQHQLKMDYSPLPTPGFFTYLRSFYPYLDLDTVNNNIVIQSVHRPKQNFLGGGYLRLGDKKLGGIAVEQTTVSPAYTPGLAPSPQLFFKFKSAEPNYSFNLLSEITTILNSYPINHVVDLDTSSLITSQNFGKDGLTFSFITTFGNSTMSVRKIKSYTDNQERQDVFNQTGISIGSANKTNQFIVNAPLLIFAHGASSPSSLVSSIVPHLAAPNELETYLLEGGTSGFNSIKSYLAFGNLFKLINSNDPLIEYYNVTDTGKVTATDYSIKLINADSIVKKGVLHYGIDEDKPDEYKNTEYVGYNVVDTNDQEYLIRHRGMYEPKTRDVISFWVREDNAFSYHYEKDFLLSNTRIEALSSNAGSIRNYGFNKVSTSGNILQIARTSAYKSVYPLAGEIPVDYSNYFALSSSWDNNFYRNYTSTLNFTTVEGIIEMKEEKGFLASKAMTVPKSFEIHTYNTGEVTYELIEPGLAIGVNLLQDNSSAKKQSNPNANKPKLIISIDLRKRLLRQLLEDITAITTIDEFERLQTIAPHTILENLTTAQINALKTSYFEKNIIDLYDTSQVSLYLKVQEGLDILNINLSEADKNAAGYKIDKDCVVKQTGAFTFTITKVLDPKVATSFSLATTLKRI